MIVHFLGEQRRKLSKKCHRTSIMRGLRAQMQTGSILAFSAGMSTSPTCRFRSCATHSSLYPQRTRARTALMSRGKRQDCLAREARGGSDTASSTALCMWFSDKKNSLAEWRLPTPPPLLSWPPS